MPAVFLAKCELLVREANQISGSQTGSQRRQASSDTGRRQATIVPANRHFRRRQPTSRDGSVAPYKRGGAGSNPVGPTTPGGMLILVGNFWEPWAHCVCCRDRRRGSNRSAVAGATARTALIFVVTGRYHSGLLN